MRLFSSSHALLKIRFRGLSHTIWTIGPSGGDNDNVVTVFQALKASLAYSAKHNTRSAAVRAASVLFLQ